MPEQDYLFSMIRVNFYFLNLFLNNKSVYCRNFVTFFVVVIYYLKKIDSTSIATFSILHSQFNYHTMPVTPFNKQKLENEIIYLYEYANMYLGKFILNIFKSSKHLKL